MFGLLAGGATEDDGAGAAEPPTVHAVSVRHAVNPTTTRLTFLCQIIWPT
jgi:hypothetical protein